MIINKYKIVLPLLLVLLAGCGERPGRRFTPDYEHNYQKRAAIFKEMRSKGIGYTVSDVPAEKLSQAQKYYELLGQEDLVLKAIKRRIGLSTDHHEIAQLIKQHGDIELSNGRLEEAQAIYAQFKQVYPGNEAIKEVLYKEVLAHFWTVRAPDRDQTETLATIELGQKFLVEYPEDTVYAPEIIKILKSCYHILLEREIITAEYYIKRCVVDTNPHCIDAAQKRWLHIVKEILPYLEFYDKKFEGIVLKVESMSEHELVASEYAHTKAEVEAALTHLFKYIRSLVQSNFYAEDAHQAKRPAERSARNKF